ncbi:MAG TPA: hypothetical protein VMS94_03960 [Acidobacteriota bacterium]|nr:hypothetical protein [Acidobacteriota bacterium]
MAKKTFDKLLLEAVDDALSSLGESAKLSIYFHLENRFKVTKNEIPNRLQDFADGLEKIFGVGAHFIEILIMKNLFEKVGQPLEWNENKELTFVEYVAVAKQSYTKKKVEAMQI